MKVVLPRAAGIIVPGAPLADVDVDAAPASGPAAPGRCPNCGAPVGGRYCAGCGQDLRHDLRRPLRRLAAELLEETLSLDGRLLHTLPALVLRPGRVAADLSRGRRARYTSPLRLYLGASLALFLAAAVGPGPAGPTRIVVAAPGEERVELTPTPGERATAARELPALAARLRARGRLGAFVADRLEHLARLPSGEVARRYAAAFREDLPRALFLLVPLLALLLKAVRRRRYYAEQLVLALHAQTIGCLALLPGALTGWEPLGWAGAAATLGWFALALRRIDGKGWGATALAVAGVGLAYAFALALVLAVTGVLAVLAI